MLLRNKNRNVKGNLIAQFVVLLIVAVILIIMVTSFGAKIWASFFPSGDKSTLKSFDMVYQVLNAKTISQKDYDYTPISVYLKEDYRILFFEKDALNCITGEAIASNAPIITTTNDIIYTKPAMCENKQCICLYKNEPGKLYKDRDKNVVKCYQIMKNITIDMRDLFQLNWKACKEGTGSKTSTEYISYLFIKYNVYGTTIKTPQPRVYVLEDNEFNRALNNDWSIPKCKFSDNPFIGLCNGQKEGTVIEAKTGSESDTKIIEAINKGCNHNNDGIISTSITCEFNLNGESNECMAQCKTGDESSNCKSNYMYCNGYNQIKGIYNLNYITPNYEYKYTYMCANDKDYCNFNGNCEIKPLMIYACKSDSSGGFDPNNQNNIALTKQIMDCNGHTEDNLALSGKWFITSYDDTDECKTFFQTWFEDQMQVLSCNPSKLDECKKILERHEELGDKQLERICQLKYIIYKSDIWLTHYNFDDNDCSKLKDLFMPVNLCRSALVP